MKKLKKFKLIKRYPGIPQRLTVGTKVIYNDRLGGYTVSNGSLFIPALQVETFPDFWEEIEDKLFTTYDGVDVYQGESWYYVIKGDNIIRKTNTTAYTGANPKPIERFHSLDRAKDYIRDTYPSISVKQLADLMEKFDVKASYGQGNAFVREVKKLSDSISISYPKS